MSPYEIKSVQERILPLYPRSMDLSLDRIIFLLEKLGNPQKKIKNIIHIAGTNGKGSVLAYLSSILLSSGYTVDSYTSPHLVHFNERIKIGGNNYDSYIDDGSLADILHECERVNDGAPITIFELITAAAFLKYSTTNSDFLLLDKDKIKKDLSIPRKKKIYSVFLSEIYNSSTIEYNTKYIN